MTNLHRTQISIIVPEPFRETVMTKVRGFAGDLSRLIPEADLGMREVRNAKDGTGATLDWVQIKPKEGK